MVGVKHKRKQSKTVNWTEWTKKKTTVNKFLEIGISISNLNNQPRKE
jgi:hypothetical protein